MTASQIFKYDEYGSLYDYRFRLTRGGTQILLSYLSISTFTCICFKQVSAIAANVLQRYGS